MNKVQDGLQKVISEIAQAPHLLTAQEKKAKIAEILQGFTSDEVAELSKKTQELEVASWGKEDGKEEANLMEVAHHMLTHPRQTNTPITIGEIPTMPTPADPSADPDGVRYDEEPDFSDPSVQGKKKIYTRGQKISTDAYDYGKEYPGAGTLQEPNNVARSILSNKAALSETDKSAITMMQQQGASFDQIVEHLTTRIKAQRREVEEKKQKWNYGIVLQDCYDYIPDFLESIGLTSASGLNQMPSKERIHMVSDYDFVHATGGKNNCLGVFRSQNGDIYIAASYLAQFENTSPIGENAQGKYPRLYREMKATIIHELLHSMSVLNYAGKDDPKKVSTRRIGLLHVNYSKNQIKGRGINEASTEHLSQEILTYLYKKEGLIDYVAPWTSYVKEQDIVAAVIADTGTTWEDFYKGMLLRKKIGVTTPDKVGPTPLVDLIRKVNGGRTINEQKRPYFFDIIMYLSDYVNENKVNIDFILDFIKKKDISIIVQQLGSTLPIVFPDKTMLNQAGTGFNETIINAYPRKTS